MAVREFERQAIKEAAKDNLAKKIGSLVKLENVRPGGIEGKSVRAEIESLGQKMADLYGTQPTREQEEA